ncbi:hypothetical protein [Agrococcus beijingensis]|uniref:hypothetical protein n=1 Tax=Agrococcus beijingensis TaxID=3068634 RepID=UPI0027428F6A|nr:hypothetical protein [Agrococcus sp. REN33]
MERIANPMAARLDVLRRTDAPEARVPLHRLLSRYGLALLAPVLMLVGPATAGAPSWLLSALTVVAISALLRTAHGSWWRSAPFGAWHLACLAQACVMLIAAVVSIVSDEPLIMYGTAILMIGAVLGVGLAQLWQSLQRRRVAERSQAW